MEIEYVKNGKPQKSFFSENLDGYVFMGDGVVTECPGEGLLLVRRNRTETYCIENGHIRPLEVEKVLPDPREKRQKGRRYGRKNRV